MNDADAAEAPTTDLSRSTIDGRSMHPQVVAHEERQTARDALRMDRIAHRYIGAPYSLRTDRVLFLVVEGCE
jgi:hypothetical protein